MKIKSTLKAKVFELLYVSFIVELQKIIFFQTVLELKFVFEINFDYKSGIRLYLICLENIFITLCTNKINNKLFRMLRHLNLFEEKQLLCVDLPTDKNLE